MIDSAQLKEALNLLSKAKCNLDYQDYVNIWGELLGSHIWRQERSDLLRIWRSGLSKEQAENFVSYIIKWGEKQ